LTISSIIKVDLYIEKIGCLLEYELTEMKLFSQYKKGVLAVKVNIDKETGGEKHDKSSSRSQSSG
jgi:hypothetical protein